MTNMELKTESGIILPSEYSTCPACEGSRRERVLVLGERCHRACTFCQGKGWIDPEKFAAWTHAAELKANQVQTSPTRNSTIGPKANLVSRTLHAINSVFRTITDIGTNSKKLSSPLNGLSISSPCAK